ncbi:phosphoribosylformylglycinamidine cyclo-ligase [Pseudothermotoga lettingae]|uniref:Phosphoribosylformylglycinamidine cyclo-ligase n=1 Tax=Pseudothermotoga lettingae (strain ATCC BAA-301 / DSM 14385 / NBRC 107922 / TMO) TaxID=416591 RepID=PUR5_PSELT|nr:phosphoribosylformylglycinamidine cyclo-ligase [Pseudothermotoga lettingae]A8F8I1.1 RecName: Full=Phosphoribosylformylglycinamidine cyclo-ligase; AltName: Full=AIR synthase; AltName: Full=AIRS; AltName: Full=Phosphoribosyl-aminoimidazole synthetase [Pseudothermotoga lettingae TMO]ABV34465.1 phosphoribosylformylglycinamidine cyclo-ligase [Pseudothermotoga lettingae TMO]GLI48588.1 phosphoribosylformylglycinamidine cyclo-ligase [Pseudothermotoga lettingae TMO]
MGFTYKDSGVDIDAADLSVQMIKRYARQTHIDGVLGDIGNFGAFFQLDGSLRQPVLVSGADGVGTKLKVAFMMDKHDTVGIDCVAMCVNDILVHGARPLFFLDYIAVGKLIPEKISQIVKGIAEGCTQAGCALIGGETAQMPDMYKEEEYDLAGFAVGVVEREKLLDGSKIKQRDAVIGLASSGLHSNGFSLVRKVLLGKMKVDEYISDLKKTLGEELLTPTKIYVRTVLDVLNDKIHGMAHITGGGLLENLPRILPEGLEFRIDKNSWEVPVIFKIIQRLGKIDSKEMYRTFNMGIGFVMVVERDEVENLLRKLNELGQNAWVIGDIVPGEKGVII